MFRTVISLSAVMVVTACSDPLAAFDRLQNVDVAPEAQTAAAVLPSAEEVARDGSFGASAAQEPETVIATPPAPQPTGIFGIFKRKSDADVTPQDVLIAPDAVPQGQIPVEIETRVSSETSPSETVPIKRGGLLGLLRGNASAIPAPDAPTVDGQRGGPDAQDVAVGTQLPFGTIARVCEAKGSALGKRVARTEAKGFTLYDTAPRTLAPRTFHITGFSDGCARQMTAATVVLTAPSTYEQFRFGPVGTHLPQGETDTAYARIKRQICGVGKNKPCGGQIKTLDRGTFFITSYRDLGYAGQWSEVLVHGGSVVATALKSNN